ncbi:hypothetical protein AALO_G00190430, partial [Alosa alosa]
LLSRCRGANWSIGQGTLFQVQGSKLEYWARDTFPGAGEQTGVLGKGHFSRCRGANWSIGQGTLF